MAKGNGIREVAPGKFIATMYDPRAKGGTKHLGTFTSPPQPNPRYKTRKAAEKAAREEKDKQERLRDLQLKAPARAETIRAFAARWPRDYTEGRGESTLLHNAERVRAFVKDFGDRSLGSVSPLEARAWIIGGIVPEEIRSVAKKWAKATTLRGGDVEVPQHTGNHLVVRAMYSDAVKTGLVPSNPFASLNVPEKEGRRGANITVLTIPELALLIETAHEVHGDFGVLYGALIEAAAWTGARPGENWAIDIDEKSTHNTLDFKAGELRINWQYTNVGKRSRPKWNSRRTVFLLPPAINAFQRAIEDRTEGPLWHTVRGLRMLNMHNSNYWERVRSAFWAKLPPDRKSKTSGRDGGPELGKIPVDFDFYELRHLYGTQLAEMGLTPPEIADQMGHKDGGQLAMERYIHPRKESVRRSMQERYAEYERKRAIG